MFYPERWNDELALCIAEFPDVEDGFYVVESASFTTVLSGPYEQFDAARAALRLLS